MTAWFQAEKAKVLLVHFRIIANDLATPNLSLLLDVFPLQQCSLSPPTFNALQLVSEDSWDFISHTLAIANDDVFTGYIGTSNVIVAVLNNYFRDEYEAFDAKARVAANNRLEQLQQRATNEGIASSDVTYSVDPEIYEGKNYLNWTFYIIAGDSYTARNEEGIHFRVKEMIDAAKGLEKSNLWKVTLKSTYTTEKKTRMVTHSGTRDKEVPVTDENGNQLYDAKGNPRTTIIKEPYSETVPEEYTAANITVSYKMESAELWVRNSLTSKI